MKNNDKSEQKKRANKLEKDLAKTLGGRRVPMSGGMQSWKGDVENAKYLYDSKHTLKPIISLLAKDLTKITREAREADKDAGHLILTFFEDNAHYAVVPYIDVDFESTEEPFIAKGSIKIGITHLRGVAKRGLRKGKTPSVLVEFEKIAFGTQRRWLIITLDTYKEKYLDGLQQ